MYTPKHFAMTPEQTSELLAAADVAQLVTAHPSGPVATLLPVLYEPEGGGLGRLLFHLTRVNDQWRDPGLGEALAIVSGPDSYIAPQWLASFAERPGVPTWNYLTVHAYGELIAHDDAAWIADAVDRLSARHGYATEQVDADALARMLRAIVGVELRITRVEAKAKLSQNKAPEDVAGVVAGLERAGEHDLAQATAAISLPHALARAELIAGVRSGRRLGEVRPTGR